MKGLKLFDGIRVSCGDIQGETGATLILFDPKIKPTCVKDVRGGWYGNLSSLSNNDKHKIDGVCVVGGSMLGFEAGAGVVSAMWKENHEIPTIEQACIFSRNLSERSDLYPTKELGEQLYRELKPYLTGDENGQVGAGTKARYGQAILEKKIGGFDFLCCVVNNAIGEVVLDSPRNEGESRTKKMKKITDPTKRRNTTITVLVTNMQMDYFELQQICIQMHASMARTIRPFNTFQDGDVFYMCSTQTRRGTKVDGYTMSEFYTQVEEFIAETIKQTLSFYLGSSS
jgi:L-aminopeptidase/D-esterase-like protein